MARSSLVASLLAAASLLLAARAGAQPTTFYLDRLLLAGAPEDGLAVFRPHIGPTRLYGQIALGYAANSLRAENLTDDPGQISALIGPPVHAQLTTYITVGSEILERGAVQVSFPLTVLQRGYPTDNAAAGLHQAVSLPGDLRIDGRVMLAESDSRRFQLAARAAVFLPTGDERSFTGDISPWSNLALAAEVDIKEVFVTVNAGATIRARARLNELTVGPEFTYALAAYAPLAQSRVRLGAELFGSLGLSPETLGGPAASPLEWSVQTRVLLNSKRTVWLGLGAGTRITGGYAPDFRGLARLGGWFDASDPGAGAQGSSAQLGAALKADRDTDRDGLADVFDLCPADKEDNIHPEDGCPDPPDRDKDAIAGLPEADADKDGSPDAVDKCPNEPGVRGEDPNTEGCPRGIPEAAGDMKLVRQLDFEAGSGEIDPKSYPVLDEIAQLLRASPETQLLRIEGHTDNVGPTEDNESLSKARADAVREYLITRGGIAKERLTSVGFGARRPIATNDTAEGRAKNRRVEVHVVTQAR
jgi:outer membrane protein OmpA-like peptidoglycan-associated protein